MADGPDITPASAERSALVAALARVAAGDRAAMQEVYRRTSAKLFGVCLRIFGERAEAEDAVQDVYLAIWRKAGTFDPARASPITWLVTLARNRSIDRLRASGRRNHAPIELADDIADDAPDAETALVHAGEDDRVLECIEHLGTGEAVMIRTAFFDGVTYAEIAERANLPLGTVKSRMRRSLLKLRDCLQ